MLKAKWDPADALTLRSSLGIAIDSVFRHPDPDAPVSTLELFGRKQDLAFEQPWETAHVNGITSDSGTGTGFMRGKKFGLAPSHSMRKWV